MDGYSKHTFYVSSGRGDVYSFGGFTGPFQLSLPNPFIFCSLWTFIIIKLQRRNEGGREGERKRGKMRTGRKRDYVK
jgi:hypothetical protein